MPVAAKTAAGSVLAAAWRATIMPISTLQTILEVEGSQGWHILVRKVRQRSASVLWPGTGAALTATVVGHFSWFFIFNLVQEKVPKRDEPLANLSRNALSGFLASLVADTTSNSLHVVKTVRQTSAKVLSYKGAIHEVVNQDGVMGLLSRGLATRYLANGLQGIMFSVLYKYFMELSQA